MKSFGLDSGDGYMNLDFEYFEKNEVAYLILSDVITSIPALPKLRVAANAALCLACVSRTPIITSPSINMEAVWTRR